MGSQSCLCPSYLIYHQLGNLACGPAIWTAAGHVTNVTDTKSLATSLCSQYTVQYTLWKEVRPREVFQSVLWAEVLSVGSL